MEVEELEDILLDVMEREFFIQLEDGSEREIAQMLWNLYRQSIRGDVELLAALRLKKLKREASRGGLSSVTALCQGQEEILDLDGMEHEEEEEDEDESMSE